MKLCFFSHQDQYCCSQIVVRVVSWAFYYMKRTYRSYSQMQCYHLLPVTARICFENCNLWSSESLIMKHPPWFIICGNKEPSGKEASKIAPCDWDIFWEVLQIRINKCKRKWDPPSKAPAWWESELIGQIFRTSHKIWLGFQYNHIGNGNVGPTPAYIYTIIDSNKPNICLSHALLDLLMHEYIDKSKEVVLDTLVTTLRRCQF